MHQLCRSSSRSRSKSMIRSGIRSRRSSRSGSRSMSSRRSKFMSQMRCIKLFKTTHCHLLTCLCGHIHTLLAFNLDCKLIILLLLLLLLQSLLFILSRFYSWWPPWQGQGHTSLWGHPDKSSCCQSPGWQYDTQRQWLSCTASWVITWCYISSIFLGYILMRPPLVLPILNPSNQQVYPLLPVSSVQCGVTARVECRGALGG